MLIISHSSGGWGSLWKASEIYSDQTFHVYIVKHDLFGPAKVVVGVIIALYALILIRVRDTG